MEDLLIWGCRYDEIRGLYVAQLVDIWVEDWTGATHMRIKKKVNSFVEGDLKYATETVSALWGLVRKDGDIEVPSTSSTVSQLWDFILRRSTHPT